MNETLYIQKNREKASMETCALTDSSVGKRK